MQIPFMRLDRQYESIRDEILPAIDGVLEGGRVLQSPEVETLERRLAALHGRAHCVALNSGTDALIFALAALGLPEGACVAVPAMSFIASVSAIVHARLVPVFVDIDPESMLMDPAPVIDLIRDGRVDAVLAVHLYGQLADLDEVAVEAERCGIPIVEDAAQAVGATRHGKPAGAWGAATCLSFDPTKVLSAYGSGGAVLTEDPALADRVRLLRYHGHAGNQLYETLGYNSQLDSLQAAILCVKLGHLEDWQARRTAIAERVLSTLDGLNAIRPVKTLPGNQHNYHKFAFQFEDRAGLAAHLKEQGVDTKVQYPTSLHRQPCFAGVDEVPVLPCVERAAESVLSLPMYAELNDAEVGYMVDAILDFYR